MRARGVANFPWPDAQGHIVLVPGPGLGPQSAQFEAAAQACKSFAPGHGGPPRGATGPGRRGRATEPAGAGRATTAGAWATFGAWLGRRADEDDFSGSVLVAKDGRALLEKGYGMADRKAGLENTPNTKFCVASIGKLFTAVAIAQLVEEGKLSFNDTIGKYVAGFPPSTAGKVTIAELLTMTSGLGDTALGSPGPPTTLAGLMQRVVKEPLQFKPGSRFSYSNDGYIVLGAVIERVTGQSYDDYLHQHIFGPAHMAETDVSAYKPEEIPGMAHGYMLVGPNGQPQRPGPPPSPGPTSTAPPQTLRDNGDMVQVGNPSGGAYSTVGDLLKFAVALTSHRLLSPAMTRTLLTPRVKANQPGGPPVDMYTYGFAYQAINGVPFLGHNGGTPGYEGQIDIYPNSGYVVVILTNQDQVMVPAIQRSEQLLTRQS